MSSDRSLPRPWGLGVPFLGGTHQDKHRAIREKAPPQGAGLGGLGSVAITGPAGEAANPPPQRPAAPLVAQRPATEKAPPKRG